MAQKKNYGLFGTVSELSREFGVDRSTVYQRIKDIQKGIETQRYNKYAICGTMISKCAFLDAQKYHKLLDDPFQSKHVPDFNPYEIAEMLALRGMAVQCGRGKF